MQILKITLAIHRATNIIGIKKQRRLINTIFATFDDKQSVKAKTEFVRRKKLGGIMFWELEQDLKNEGLVDEMYEQLKMSN